ncbi:MAG: GDP-fucose synthetase [Verrucomicrobiaceae bacterium]|nr:GDP-fucose synthetase [Verrucomicrobiaceae bacterium]
MTYNLKGKRIWVAGHNGMVGGAIVRRLEREDCKLIAAERDVVDLTRQNIVQEWMRMEKPDTVILAAAKVGGIHANNTRPVDFLYDNLMIQTNIIHAAHEINVERLLFLGSSCIYPKFANQPIKEDSLLTGSLEPTNECYAIAKIAGLKLIQAFRTQYMRDWISAMPTNLYGPGDNYDLETSHVIPALLRKFHKAKQCGDDEVIIWGTGSPVREFMHCDDLADALVFILKNYSGSEHLNIGSGQEVSIKELSEMIAEVVGYRGKLTWDPSKPNGAPRKLLDSSRLKEEGWDNSRLLENGIMETYAEWCQEMNN